MVIKVIVNQNTLETRSINNQHIIYVTNDNVHFDLHLYIPTIVHNDL